MLFYSNSLVIFLSFSFFIIPIWSESSEENDGIEVEVENEENSNDEGNPLMDALGLDGVNLDELGTVLQQLPQTIDTLQKLFTSGGLENLGEILASLQEKFQHAINPAESVVDTCQQPDPIDMFLLKDPFHAYDNSDENLEKEEEEQIPSEETKDEL